MPFSEPSIACAAFTTAVQRFASAAHFDARIFNTTFHCCAAFVFAMAFSQYRGAVQYGTNYDKFVVVAAVNSGCQAIEVDRSLTRVRPTQPSVRWRATVLSYDIGWHWLSVTAFLRAERYDELEKLRGCRNATLLIELDGTISDERRHVACQLLETQAFIGSLS